jgi:hypothetical protein
MRRHDEAPATEPNLAGVVERTQRMRVPSQDYRAAGVSVTETVSAIETVSGTGAALE